VAFAGPLLFAGLIALWWLFGSRARLSEKAVGFVGLAAIAAVTTALADKSVQGMGTMIYAIPWGITGFSIGLICLARVAAFQRTWVALLAALICFGFWDPVTGAEVWQRDIGQDAGRQPPTWGYSSSPLVTDGVVIVHAGGTADRGLLAYDAQTGEIRWTAPAGDHSYSSPQLSDILGTPSVLMLTNKGLTFHEPATGRLLGKHDWVFGGYRVLQPLVLDGSSVLLGTAMGTGTKRISVTVAGDGFAIQEQWLSKLSPTFNDFVAHAGYLYGFDNNIFACVDLADGQRKWKGGRYGNGQVLLLPRGDQLLVLSEEGELVLLRATPEKLVELARHPALAGRTWNHPVLVGDRLYVRNGEEAACFAMPVADVAAGDSAPAISSN